jgi:hypothetical protein
MTFYDSTGSQCFRMVITMEGDSTTTAYYSKNDELCYEMTTDADNTVTYDVDGKVYVYYPDDGSWDCPDGTTWTLPPFCENAEVEEADAPDTADTGMCPPVTRMCKPEELPDF